MKRVARIAAIALALPTLLAATRNSPVPTVLNLLEAMLVKGKDEKQKEQVRFATYKQFCVDTIQEKTKTIKDAEEAISMLEADAEKYDADIAQLDEYIAKDDANLLTWSGDKKKASEVRKAEAADYAKMHKDYSESAGALKRAISSLEQGQPNVEVQARGKFMQLTALQDMPLIPTEAKEAVTSFLTQDAAKLQDEDADLSRHRSPGYEFQSQGLIELLKRLLDKFLDERTKLEREEVSAKHTFQLFIKDLDDQTKQTTVDRSDKITTKTGKMEAMATAKGNLADVVKARDGDKTYLNEVTTVCKGRALAFKSDQDLRTEEINAISKAIEIISSDAVSKSSEKHLQSLLQDSTGAAQVQLVMTLENDRQAQLAPFLRKRARSIGSFLLLQLADKAAGNPFKRVRGMIRQLLIHLMEEANKEASHKGWCDSELATNEKTRKEKTDAIEALQAEIESLKASMAKLGEEIAVLTEELGTLEVTMGKATVLRSSEKASNSAAGADAKAAQNALSQAVAVLKDFYAKAGEATMLQLRWQDPDSPDGPYQGMQAESVGIVGLLEVIQSDFARLEAETRSSEIKAQKEYDAFMTASRAAKDMKQTDLEHKNAQQQDESQDLVVKEDDLEDTQSELNTSLDYFDKLKSSCVNTGGNAAERNARRKEEIETLQLALKILSGEDIS
mmetsp:Transcript_130399/g.260141  ORF Transcript_130399/g.260141 Transcript_130399/m.260141 type:complete len:676 (-) Transcript_130399:153-2180(-)